MNTILPKPFNDIDRYQIELMKSMRIHHKIEKGRVTKSYRKGRYARIQQIFDRNGFVVKQIIHHV